MKKLWIVGIGPGGGKDLTGRAQEALSASQIIIGYPVYVDLLRRDYPQKEFCTTPMRREVERCEMALALAESGKAVSLVCSGDPGVYGMAALCYELHHQAPEVELEVIPGVTSATGGAALLGAPLTHDFAVISLSDLLTPWEQIEKRLRGAAQAGFILCIYNPASHQRPDHLRRACRILLEVLPPDTPCGTASRVGRAGESYTIQTLEALADAAVDMFTTVYVGNRSTRVIDGKLVTPRGYLQRGD